MISEKPFGRRFANLVLALLVLSASSCAAQGQRLAAKPLEILRADGSAVTVKAELAVSGEEREIGLMYRKKLADGDGMLFLFPQDQILSFWMKNTLIPLSIAYIASDGRILELRDMRAQSLEAITSERSARFALEVPLGWFARARVAPGDRLEVSGLPSAR